MPGLFVESLTVKALNEAGREREVERKEGFREGNGRLFLKSLSLCFSLIFLNIICVCSYICICIYVCIRGLTFLFTWYLVLFGLLERGELINKMLRAESQEIN